MNYFVFLRILLLLATLKELLAIPVVILNNQSSEIKLLGPQVEVWRDTLSYTLNQVRRLQSEIDFKCPQDKPNNSASLHSAYWIRFKVVNNSECPLWLLEFPDLHIGHIQVYEGDSMIGTGGYLENFENRGLLHKNPSYYIKPGREKEYYIRLQSDLGASFHMKIKSPLYYSSYAHQEYYYLGLYYGVILIMAIYNFFLFLKIREWAYLFYVFYVLSCALHTFREDGIGFQFFWPNNPWMNYYFKEISFLLLMLSFVTYSILFLNLYERQRQFFWFTIGSVLAYLCLFTWITVSDTIREAHTIYFLVPILLVYFAAILQYRRGQRFVRYFLLAYSILIISLLIYMLRKTGMLPTSKFVIYNFNISFILEVVIMSLALGDKFRIERLARETAQRDTIQLLQEKDLIQQQLLQESIEKEMLKDKVNKELEMKVQQRTLELHQKNEALTAANQQLDRVYKEMERMNSALDKNNWELQKEIKQKKIESIRGENISYEKFLEVFYHEQACLKFLEELKWKDGYTCRKCGNTKYHQGDIPFSRKCSKCNLKESVTANTLYHRLKFELNKAFYLTYLFSNPANKESVERIADKLSMNVLTCRKFKARVLERKEALPQAQRWEELIMGKAD